MPEYDKIESKNSKKDNPIYVSYDKMSAANYPSVEDSVMSINKKAIEDLTPDKGTGTKIIRNHTNKED